MYLRWAERHRFKTEIVDQQEGEQAGIKSATVEIDGRAAYGWMRAERGVHRLVRISPFDSQKRRQTTFALVEVLPEADDDIEIELNWDEIRVDTFRSQGAGGQHVNKTDSAVRLTHLPTGIVAQSQNERSQTQNKEMAIRVLKARLLERALEEQEAEVRKLKGEHVEAGWGNQIRSYVLHPYQMVKDLRTGHETGNTQAVLDGDLDAFMQAELERLATGGGARRRRAGRRRASDGRRRRRGRRRGASRAPRRRATDDPAGRGADDLATCAAIWRDALNDYLGRLAQPEIPDDLGADPAPLRPPPRDRSGDVPRRRAGAGGGRRGRAIDAFVVGRPPRARSWFLSMLFVRPGGPGSRPRPGAARRGRCRPDGGRRRLAGDRDGQRPADLERALRARSGIVPRIPLLRLVGLPERAGALGAAAGRDRGDRASTRSTSGGRRARASALAAELAALDRDAAGLRADRPDHAFLAREGRIGFLFRDRTGGAVGYGYTLGGRPGRARRGPRRGPARTRSSATSSTPSGRAARSGSGCPGSAGEAVVPLLRAGFRFDGFPVLLCWDRPFADFARFLPMSPGLL